jgi:hypothetical protein
MPRWMISPSAGRNSAYLQMRTKAKQLQRPVPRRGKEK